MPSYFLNDTSDPERSASLERSIRETVPDLIKIATIEAIDPAGIASATERPYVLVVGPRADKGFADRLIGIAERHRDRLFFILVSDEISALDYKRLVRTDAADWVSAASAAQEVADIFARRREAARGAERDVERRNVPITIAFVPAAGGVGNATLAAEIAMQLNSRKDLTSRRICIADLDFQTGHVCDRLDIDARLQIREIVEDPARLDTRLFDHFISRHESGVDVLAAPRSKFNVSDVGVATLDALFDMMAQRYDWILIDMPLTWFGWTEDAIANATGIIVSGINTIPCLRQVSETLALVRACRPVWAPVAIAINRCERGLLGRVARQQHVKSIIPDDTVFFVRNDEAEMVESANTGVPVSLGTNRDIVKDIAAIASFCAALSPEGLNRPDAKPAKRRKA